MFFWASVVQFGYEYAANENNIHRKTFDHRSGDPYNEYGYDDLDRLTDVTYHDSDTEAFVMDALGNRTGNQALRSDGTVNFTVQSLTNRYTSIGGNSITHDDAGNLTVDRQGYVYFYDYENRVVKIKDSSNNDVAEYAYDAFGRRIRMIDKAADPDVTTLYYYNPDWQCLAEYNGAGALQRYFVYGNYIDEVLVMTDYTAQDDPDYFYGQDHLYSTVVLFDAAGAVVERYEYDAYGTTHIMDALYNPRSTSLYGNPYTFTGRRLDVLDSGDLLRMHYRHRDYDTYAGRFLQHDPRGLNPAVFRVTAQELKTGEGQSKFKPITQYIDCGSVYEYCASSPVTCSDPFGLNIYVMTGNDSIGPNNWFHQSVCVDEWTTTENPDGSLSWVKTGEKICFSFGMTGVGITLPKKMWLGFNSLVLGGCLRGKIYQEGFTGGVIDRYKLTTGEQDRKWLSYMLYTRLRKEDVYSVARHDCRKYSQLEFDAAPEGIDAITN